MSNARFCGTNKKSHLKGCGRMRQRLSRQIIFIYLFIFIFFSSVEAMQKSVSAQALLSSVGMTKSGFDKAHSIVVRAQRTRNSETDPISVDLANTLIIHHSALQSPFSQSMFLPSRLTILLFNPQPQAIRRLSSVLDLPHLQTQHYLG